MAAVNTRSLVKREDVQHALYVDEGLAKLISFQVKDFTARGDNYSCDVSSVELTYEKDGKKQQKTYVVKLNQLNVIPMMYRTSEVFFEKEVNFYKEIVPLLNKELAKLKLSPLCMPKYFHSVARPREEVIYLEDMRKRGFKMLDQKVGMDRNHTMLIIKELAKLHAISRVLMNNKEFKTENLKKKFPFLRAHELMIEDTGYDLLKPWYNQAMAMCAEIIESNKDYEYVAKFFRSLVPNIIKIVYFSWKADEPFLTICHGDCWNNNFLFR